MSSQYLIELENISKNYGQLAACSQIDLQVKKGVVHGLIGENGAGKSTLMKIIYGIVKNDEGLIKWKGEVLKIKNPIHARELGIAMIFQHFSLFDSLSVFDNILLGLNAKQNDQSLKEKIKNLSQEYGLNIDLQKIVFSLSSGERQRIEILRCLLQEPQLLIMDEPTSVLTPQESKELFKTLRIVSEKGCSILYISHKLAEITDLCSIATVLRQGKKIDTCIPQEETIESLAEKMVGKQKSSLQKPASAQTGEVIFEIQDLNYTSSTTQGSVSLKDINFKVKAGEIFGIAGIAGNGQSELFDILSGEVSVDNKVITYDSKAIGNLSIQKRRKLGLSYIVEERLDRGSVTNMSLSDNLFLTGIGQLPLSRNGILDKQQSDNLCKQLIEDFNIKAKDETAEAGSLSGGNLQKYIVGREIIQKPKVLVVSAPTWGVDVRSAQFIQQKLINMATDDQVAIIVISQDLDELFLLCDTISVINQGHLSTKEDITNATFQQIGLLMAAS